MAAAAAAAAPAGQLPQATGGGGGSSGGGGTVGVGNPAYIVAVVVVVGCVLGLVWVALRKTVCSRDRRGRGRGQVRDAPPGGGPPPSPIYLRGLLFGNPGLSPTASPFRGGSAAGMPPPPPPSSAYRPWAAAPAAADDSTPRRGLLIDVPLAGSPTLLDEAALKQLPLVTYRGASGAGRQHRRQGSSGVSASGRFGDDRESSKESSNNKESSRDNRDVEHGGGGGGSFSEGCSVCLSAFADGESVRVLPDCGHMFHLDCVDPWLLAHAASCPLCRAEVTGTARGCGGGPGAKRLAKLLARFGGQGRSFRCSSRSFSGSLRDLGSSFRSRLGSDHGSFRARLGADQQQHQDGGDAGGTTRSQRFLEIDLGHHSPRDARPQDSPLRPLRTADHAAAAAASGSQDTDPAPAPGGAGTAQQPPSPAGLRHLRLPSSTDVVATGGDDNSTTPRLGSSRTPRSLQQPLSPGGGRVDI